ncbi:DNA translocase FtsK 4TM domain-containing protein [Caulobacter sp. B11]|uniref:DNA translocase FtsK 4TM domain-containing protein n=1 Tax=Caulobacter sp. B11 TaxID=2048899 RepID=UPI001F19C8C3|nr:DNA translocase FtsK 4TM domain-containing protein [Caulobacter sp. B11]
MEAFAYGWSQPLSARFRGGVVTVIGGGLLLALATYNATDPSLNAASAARATNALGGPGAAIADILMQSLGLAGWISAALMLILGLTRATQPDPVAARRDLRIRSAVGAAGVLAPGRTAGRAAPAGRLAA